MVAKKALISQICYCYHHYWPPTTQSFNYICPKSKDFARAVPLEMLSHRCQDPLGAQSRCPDTVLKMADIKTWLRLCIILSIATMPKPGLYPPLSECRFPKTNLALKFPTRSWPSLCHQKNSLVFTIISASISRGFCSQN